MLKICINLLLFVHFVWNCADGEVSDGRIVGGRLAREGEFPFQVSVRRSYNDAHFCGGSIISPKHVLTAAHCMYYVWGGQLPPIVISVVAGQLSLNITKDGVFRNASKVTIHPNFDKELMANDIAIIELAEDFPSEDKLITPIVLNNNKSVDDDLPCIVSGWGVQEYNEDTLSNSLLATEVEIVNFASCSEKYLNINVTLQEGMLCATNRERKADACQGDSGGPLICKGALMGIISTGSGCADSNFPGIYTDVKCYFSWIEEVVNPNVDDEGRNDESSFDFTGDLLTPISFDNIENFTEQSDEMINIRLNNTSNGCCNHMSLYFYGALIMLLNKV